MVDDPTALWLREVPVEILRASSCRAATHPRRKRSNWHAWPTPAQAMGKPVLSLEQASAVINNFAPASRYGNPHIFDGRHWTARAARTNTYGGDTDAVINDDFREVHKGGALRWRIQRGCPMRASQGTPGIAATPPLDDVIDIADSVRIHVP